MREKIRGLISVLKKHDRLYNEGNPIISDQEYDNMYFELQKLEQETGMIFPDSPTQTINYEVVNGLTKVTHSHPMLSLAKTKSVDDVMAFFGNHDYIVMPKLDGLTCSLSYINGELVGAETRGNGIVGEDILHNARVIKSIPQRIWLKDPITIDGEIICKDNDFIKFKDEYTHPRNFAAGSIRLLDSSECEKRDLTFIAWDLFDNGKSPRMATRLNVCKWLGFETAFNFIIPEGSTKCEIEALINLVKKESTLRNYPIDGAVFKFNNIAYGDSRGQTSHHKNNALAFKFRDDEFETKVIDIDWTMGRSGKLSPVAVVVPVIIDETTVSRANLHNLSVMEEMGLEYYETPVLIAKMNQIIPQIVDVSPFVGERKIEPPAVCPVCGEPTQIIVSESGTRDLYCTNPNCQGKLINKIDHFASKKGLDIKGLSIATLETLISKGWINNFADLFNLYKYRNEWVTIPGFGEKSVDKIISSIETARVCSFEKFLCAIGIPLIGAAQSKEIAKHIASYEDFRDKVRENFNFGVFDGFAEAKTASILKFDYADADAAYEYVKPAEKKNQPSGRSLTNVSVVITGTLKHFKNRDELKDLIEACGGRVVGSVSKNTSYLINNDISSTSSKNEAAKKLNIPILTEDDFIKKFDLL